MRSYLLVRLERVETEQYPGEGRNISQKADHSDEMEEMAEMWPWEPPPMRRLSYDTAMRKSYEQETVSVEPHRRCTEPMPRIRSSKCLSVRSWQTSRMGVSSWISRLQDRNIYSVSDDAEDSGTHTSGARHDRLRTSQNSGIRERVSRWRWSWSS